VRRTTVRWAVCALLVVLGSVVCARAGGLQNNPELVLDIEEGSWRQFMGWKIPTLVTDRGDTAALRWPKTVGGDDADRGAVPVRQSWYPPENWKDPTRRVPVRLP